MFKCTVGRKRKWTDEHAQALEKTMPLNISDRKLFAVLNEMKVEPVSLKTHSRGVAQKLAPASAVFQSHAWQPGDGESITLHVANIQSLLQYYMEASSNFRDHVLRGLQSSDKQLPLILYADHCRAGNILAPVSQKKFLMISPESAGRARIHAFIADHDEIRNSYSLKGSAGIRPCLLCCVLQRSSPLQSDDLPDISSSDLNACHRVTDDEFSSACQRLRTLVTSGARVKDVDRLQKITGLNYERNAFVFDNDTLMIMPPSKILFDSMHTFYSNGITASELALYVHRLATCNISLEALQKAIAEVPLRQPGHCHTRGKSWLKFLFDARRWQEDAVRGAAWEIELLLPLIRF